jgi:CHAT domain-containing protein
LDSFGIESTEIVRRITFCQDVHGRRREGDPDNSLPGAREEARQISTILGGNSKLEIGDEATIDEFRLQAPTSGIIHLATHSYLDRTHPAESYLIMAGGRRMSIIAFR